MKKFSKIILAISLLIFTSFAFFNCSFAVNTTEENDVGQASTRSAVQNTNLSTNQTSGQITTTVSSTNSADEGFLSISNIINILLIAVGIVIIFLAIAIIIRLK
ncbi:MAG: hypothetical protein J6K42_04845 [Clostridia bacterium]|nr:hypothetical protein [Clostridia bacterium]